MGNTATEPDLLEGDPKRNERLNLLLLKAVHEGLKLEYEGEVGNTPLSPFAFYCEEVYLDKSRQEDDGEPSIDDGKRDKAGSPAPIVLDPKGLKPFLREREVISGLEYLVEKHPESGMEAFVLLTAHYFMSEVCLDYKAFTQTPSQDRDVYVVQYVGELRALSAWAGMEDLSDWDEERTERFAIVQAGYLKDGQTPPERLGMLSRTFGLWARAVFHIGRRKGLRFSEGIERLFG